MLDLLLSYYGDDLTGSTDVMESLALHGVPTVLFLRPPSPEKAARFADCRAIGYAGTSRSETPEWMDEHLAAALRWLENAKARVCHYKVCSTFDSAPRVGNIGRAIEIGRTIFAQARVPLVVGAPQLKRFTAFGNLFAAYRGEVFRIDRHPVMSRHPVTPMAEADLRRHLAGQTALKTGLVDLATLAGPDVEAAVDRAMASEEEIVLFDVMDAASQATVGRALDRISRGAPTFVVGSSGIEYALLSAWRASGLLPTEPPRFVSPGPVDRIAVVSGSCSPTTERQIRHAETQGFAAIAADPVALAGPDAEAAIAAATTAGLAALAQGRSVVVYTALGPSTDQGGAIDAVAGARHAIGRALGRIEHRLVVEAGLKRAVIAGGDTSSHALAELGVYALTTCLPLPRTPGSPLCTAHADDPATDGLQVALKGGQIGEDGYFVDIRDGRA